MDAILWTKFSNTFLAMEMFDFEWNFIETYSGESSWQNISIPIGSGYGLVLSGNKPQPVPMLTNIHGAIELPLGHKE